VPTPRDLIAPAHQTFWCIGSLLWRDTAPPGLLALLHRAEICWHTVFLAVRLLPVPEPVGSLGESLIVQRLTPSQFVS